MAKTILLDYDTDSIERFREAGEILRKVDREGVPAWKAMGEPEPPKNQPAFAYSMMNPIAYMQAVMSQGED